jgi:hypothetical protein
MDSDEGLARAGGQREERPLLAPGKLLQHCPDGGILVLPPGRLAPRIAREEGTSQRRFETEAHPLLIAGAQVGRGWKLGETA